jgi:CTP synthase (UTP-ammonia lyase)
MRVALIGDFKPAAIAHQAIPIALEMAGVEGIWIHTRTISDVNRQLSDFDGIWCVPASPYENTAGALDAIRYAREQKRPFLGSCGGFQHAVIEYARNVRGLADAAHAETDPGAGLQLITPLECPLVEQTGEIILLEDSRIGRAYGTNRISEGYHCSYGINPELEAILLDGDLRVTARDPDGAIRALELSSHPFFVATLFQSERRALRGEIPPLVVAFVDACSRAAQI